MSVHGCPAHCSFAAKGVGALQWLDVVGHVRQRRLQAWLVATMVPRKEGCRSDSAHTIVCIQVTYDKLETKNLFSPHFGECRGGWIELQQDPESDLMIGRDAANYEVCAKPPHVLTLAVQGFWVCRMRRCTGCSEPCA